MPKPKAPPPLPDEQDVDDIDDMDSVLEDAALDDLDLPEISEDEESDRVVQPDGPDA